MWMLVKKEGRKSSEVDVVLNGCIVTSFDMCLFVKWV
jgi:hypothetical protein